MSPMREALCAILFMMIIWALWSPQSFGEWTARIHQTHTKFYSAGVAP